MQLADTLRRIAADGRKGYYEGSVAKDIVNKLRSLGGFHNLSLIKI